MCEFCGCMGRGPRRRADTNKDKPVDVRIVSVTAMTEGRRESLARQDEARRAEAVDARAESQTGSQAQEDCR